MPGLLSQVTFWGVRGSTPTVDRDTLRYGGNTPCLEVQTPDGGRLILDCGTGLRLLGNRWSRTLADEHIEAHVLVTHYHWDHIQGIPFFNPFYCAQNRFYFYSFRSEYLGPGSLRQVMEAQLARPYFPVDLSAMGGQRIFQEISGGDVFSIGGTEVKTAWLNHPQGCLGYRLNTAAGSIVYATDNEPGNRQADQALRELAAGADILIQDAQYSPEQIAGSRKGWGHSSWLEGAKIAREARVRNLVLFHHDPDSSDKTVDGFLQAARQEFPACWAAIEGMSFSLSGGQAQVGMRRKRLGQRRDLGLCAQVSGEAEDGSDFDETTVVNDLSLQGAFFRLATLPRLQSEVRVTLRSAPDGPPAAPLRGTVVRSEAGGPSEKNGVAVVFIDDVSSGRPWD